MAGHELRAAAPVAVREGARERAEEPGGAEAEDEEQRVLRVREAVGCVQRVPGEAFQEEALLQQ